MTEFTIATRGGEVTFAAPEGRTVLFSALAAGIGFPNECASGGCGLCRFTLAEGSVETLWKEAPGLSARDRGKGDRHLACQCRPLSDLVVEFRPDEHCRAPVPPARHVATLVDRRMLTDDLGRLTFRLSSPMVFEPGQFVLLEHAETAGERRAYSLANLPDGSATIDLILRRIPGGRFSSLLFDRLQCGDGLTVEGPYGQAYLRRGTGRPILCVGGGSGLAPMLSIARAALSDPNGASPGVTFFYGARTAAQLPDLAALGLGPSDPRLRVVEVLSTETPGWTGPICNVHEAAIAALGAGLADHDVYLCGSPAMVTTAVRDVLEAGARREQIHFDSFY